MPEPIFEPTTDAELARFLAERSRRVRASDAAAVYAVGGRTAFSFGHLPPRQDGTLVSLRGLADVVDYPAEDMTVTVQAGLRWEELVRTLKERGQRLPIDVSEASRATVGGVLAANVAGPRRFGHGTLRDYVIGISAVDGQGRLFRAGGRVVKNVAGYDLCKLLIGSLGTLAIVTEVTFKVRPAAERTAFVCVRLDTPEEAERCIEFFATRTASRPDVLDYLSGRCARHVTSDARMPEPVEAPLLIIGVEGTAKAVDWQVERICSELAELTPSAEIRVIADRSERLLEALTEFRVSADALLTLRASLPSSCVVAFMREAERLGLSAQAHAADGIVVGHVDDDGQTVDDLRAIVRRLRALAVRAGGGLIVEYCPDHWRLALSTWGRLPLYWPVMCRIKQQLDPAGILGPGRWPFRSEPVVLPRRSG
ncbi:MAG: FAD-binding oxidoreductase [Planctomycetota bacterium]|nr:MAG: FAD-binding oxidoreductase [Planctomycetota bacterium]